MMPAMNDRKTGICFSLGMMAWNEQDSIRLTLESLFQQSIFERLAARGEKCEFIVLANGCTDRTVPIATEFLENMQRTHPWSAGFVARVIDIKQAGRNNAWNCFVHEYSAREARVIGLVDADIIFTERETVFNLVNAIDRDPHIHGTSGRQRKDIVDKKNKTILDRISIATSNMTGTIEGRISGQLYCLRASVARNLLLPRDLSANDDGFFKQAICSDFFSRPVDASHIITVPNAEHIYEAYVAPRDILNNQKRQMIGQTCVHVLIEYLKTLPLEERRNLADTLRRHEMRDPDWLKKLIAAHLRKEKHFWRLFPGILTFRFQRLMKMRGLRKLTYLPAACAGLVVTMIACYRAHRAIRAGSVHYWPKATRETILAVPQVGVNK
jgi:glycosyltransferase involved in cell wall biosynthesis